MSSDYESSSASPSASSSEEEEEWNSPKKRPVSRARRAKRATPTRRNPRRYTTAEMDREIRAMHENSDASEDSEEEEEEVVKKPKRSVRTAARSRRNIKEDSDDGDSSVDQQPRSNGTPSRPTRRCAAATQLKMSSAVKSDLKSEKEALGSALEESEAEMLNSSDDSSESEKRPTKRSKKRKANDSSDEEYEEGLFNDDSSENDSEEYQSDDSDEGVARKSKRPQRSCARNKKSYKVTEQDLGTADEESADEDTGPSILISPSKNSAMPYGSPKLREKARARRRPLVKDDESSDDDSHKQTYFQHKCAQKKSPSKLKTTSIDCPSKYDEITMMELPKGEPHICYVTPDNKNRHCFTLETMYRIAISKRSETSALLSSSGPLQFLQPPHFRTSISDDLLDQIASRFGRLSLVIEDSSLYKKMKARSSGNFRGDIDLDDDMDNFDSDGEYVGPHRQGRNGQNFDERFQRYIQSWMGSQDIYCCPLCYNEASRRQGNMDDDEIVEDDASDDEGNNDQKEDRFSFLDDPMTILGCLDGQEFAVASTFCFRLLTGVKNHLRSIHHVDLTVIQGNDLFKRFQIRAGDGLLQSWLRKYLKKNMAQPLHLQGDMMRYWNEGANQSFLLLLDQIDRGELEGRQSGDYGSDFSESFPNRASKIWEEVSSPFLKVQDDMHDFLADDDEDEEGESVPINPHFTPPNKEGENLKSPEDEMLEYLKRKNSERGADSSAENSGSSSENEESDELEVLSKQEAEEDEEEDEWMKSKQLASKKRAKKRSKGHEGGSDSDDLFDGNGAPDTLNGNAKTIGTDDSDEEKPPTRRSSGSARKRLAESSDDES